VKISSVHGNFLHKELTQKDTIISSLQSEMKAVRQNNKAVIDQLTTENSEKQSMIISLQDRVSSVTSKFGKSNLYLYCSNSIVEKLVKCSPIFTKGIVN